MTKLQYIYSAVLMILILSIPKVYAQKLFYAPGNEEFTNAVDEDKKDKLYSVYLIGDLKYPNAENENLKMLKNYLLKENDNSSIVLLGDLLYPLGLHDSASSNYAEDVKNLDFILQIFDDYKGNVIFVPGNHDWKRGQQNGLSHLNNLETYIENHFASEEVFLPNEGCPGPEEIYLSEDVTLIVFDSQWYFQKNEKPESGCDVVTTADLFIQIEDALKRNEDKKIILASHHPLYSVGYHGGYYPASYNLFPLLAVSDWAYLPLPGFIYTGYRKYLGSVQDLAHPDYKLFQEALTEMLKDYPNAIYAAGHEHNLQYFAKDSLHHIVSGGGGEGTYISKRKKKTDFAYQNPGFSRLSFYDNGNVWLEFISPNESPEGELVYSKKLYNKAVFDPNKQDSIIHHLDFSDSTVTVQLSEVYNASSFVRSMMGDNYRNLWSSEVELPVFDIDTEKGGLKIIKRGGGQQTRSIRMKDEKGKQYVLRSVNKYVEKALSEIMRNTVAVDVLQDGISASNPFSALTVPQLASAAGVMHTNPKLVWVPDDPRLGIFQDEVANGVFLFEERPAGNRKDIESFGRSKKIVNTAEVIKKTQKDHQHIVDQESVVRARVFDVLINDWDRHDDQWRWATFKKKKKVYYRPIPRDRDQVFFVNEGFVMRMAALVYPTRKFQGFDYEIKDMKGLTFNGRYFDRAFMTEPSLEQWMEIASDIQANITDEIIHQAVSELPENIYDSVGLEIEGKLKSRRNLLDQYAKEHYLFLAKAVDVVGTKDRDYFEVERKENGDTKVSMFAMTKKKGKIRKELYSREFKYDETKEVRLYGLKGEDKFFVYGEGDKGIKVRIIGGKDKDRIKDESKVKGLGKKTIVYDRKDKKNKITKGSETKLQLSKKKSVNKYDRKQYKPNTAMPQLHLGYNNDDGIILGPGVDINRFNFRDSTVHKLKATIALRTGAFTVGYESVYTTFSKNFDFKFDSELSLPRNVDNYFGQGNETKKVHDKNYYRVRYEYAWINPALRHHVTKHFNYSIGLFYQYYKTTDTTNRYIADLYPEQVDSSAFIPHNYIGVNGNLIIDTRDKELLPNRGVFWKTDVRAFYSVLDEGKNFIKVRSDLRFYLSFKTDPRVVFVLRFGGAANIGDYEFFHANFLGFKTNLRGYRSNRFAGDYSFYQNTEARVKLFDINSYILNGQTGFYVFNDIGRVWVKEESSTKWHNGLGIGLWLAPFNSLSFNIAYNHSVEEDMFTFAFKFLF